MKSKLNLMFTVAVLLTAALCWTGCSSLNSFLRCDDPCEPTRPQEEVCPPVCEPVCPPIRHHKEKVCRPAEDCEEKCEPGCAVPVKCAYPNSNRICCDGVILTASQPKLCILGDNYALDICLQACADLCHVEVNAILPEGVSLVGTEPENQKVSQHDNQLTWEFPSMRKGETLHNRVLLRADREGDLCVCFCVTAVPVRFCSILCARPMLECSKCGPEEVCPGDPVHYTITVTNKGSCAAEEVVVTDEVPDGLEHSSGLRTLTFKLGTLEPCQTKTINVCFTACKRGQICNEISVTACNANPVHCRWCTDVTICDCEVVKVGPKERKIGEAADYEITVTNPGDKTLTGVIVTDCTPSATSIVEAKGAIINGNKATWKFDELAPGDSKKMGISLTTCTPGYYVNRVSVDNCQRCCCSAETGTRWKGSAALGVCFTDTEDLICVGEYTTYKVQVHNQGSEDDTNLRVVVRFPDNVVPVHASGDAKGSISGNTVTFGPVKALRPRENMEFVIKAQSKSKGEARIRAEISSDTVHSPIIQEESTMVF